MKRTIQILTTHNSSATAGLVNFAGNRGRRFSHMMLIIFLTTMQLLFAAIGTAQQPPQKKPGNTGQMQAQSSVPDQMPDFKGVTFEQAKKDLITNYRQERIESKPGPWELPPGIIYNQEPRAGTPLRSDTRITLYVSTGPATVTSTIPTAEISVIKTLVKKRAYVAGEPIQYTIVVSNAGPSTATNVQIVDTPTNIKLENVSGECSVWPCTIKSIEAGSSSEPITVTATIIAAGAFDNSVTVTAAESDPKIANNTDNDNRENASSSADISATERLDTVGPFRVGQSVQYTMIVRNAGPSNATNIRIDDKPRNLTISDVSLKIRDVSEPCNEFPCTIANLARGEVATITLTASIDRDGSFENGADVTAAEHDVDPSNNNVPNTGGIATPASPSPSPPPYPPPWLGPVLILIVGGLAVAGGGTYVIWHWILPPSPVPPTPPHVPPAPPVSPLPPDPVVNASVNLEPGRTSIDGLRMTAPEMHLRTSLEMGESIFDGPVPIIRREVINE